MNKESVDCVEEGSGQAAEDVIVKSVETEVAGEMDNKPETFTVLLVVRFLAIALILQMNQNLVNFVY